MFTGIITRVGRIERHQPLGSGADHGLRLHVAAGGDYLADVALGDSIAINGACMTVTSLDPAQGVFTVDVSAESLARTTGLDRPGPVNLEKAMRPADRLGGHIVSGHVDGVGTVTRLAAVGESWNLCVLAPPALAKYLAYKGSITVNGVSLTVNHVADRADGCEVSINLIPHTMQHTALGTLMVGARVNLEVDMIARYVERMLSLAAVPPAA
ncbi:Riboflavin synthase [Tepidimonas fonticaldi]|uniref:Riboflavin synthase n=1 Tax=Tepidimonas fonticaldi TaxID=1101373 RepID=A0A554XH15_9BURK|nr:riboflavin synthase [Tepidimonas fonticaldi]TSE35108.1 Riboflavin synthase [Tepidimonas fonticaldi]